MYGAILHGTVLVSILNAFTRRGRPPNMDARGSNISRVGRICFGELAAISQKWWPVQFDATLLERLLYMEAFIGHHSIRERFQVVQDRHVLKYHFIRGPSTHGTLTAVIRPAASRRYTYRELAGLPTFVV